MPSHAPAQLDVAHKEKLLVPPCCHSRLLLPRDWEFLGASRVRSCACRCHLNFPRLASFGGCTDHLQGCGALQNEFYLDSNVCPLFSSSRLNFPFSVCCVIFRVRFEVSLVVLVPRGQMTPVLKSSLHGGKSQSLIPI